VLSVSTLFATKESQLPRRFARIEMAPPESALEHYMPSGFSFLVDRWDEQMGCLVSFDANVYDPALVHAFIERYRLLAAELIGDLDRPLSRLMPPRRPDQMR
jgi:hypothetical protein